VSSVEGPTPDEVSKALAPCRQQLDDTTAEVRRLTLARDAELARHARDLAQVEGDLALAERQQALSLQALDLLKPLEDSAVAPPSPKSLVP
jgi:hypothetical protein